MRAWISGHKVLVTIVGIAVALLACYGLYVMGAVGMTWVNSRSAVNADLQAASASTQAAATNAALTAQAPLVTVEPALATETLEPPAAPAATVVVTEIVTETVTLPPVPGQLTDNWWDKLWTYPPMKDQKGEYLPYEHKFETRSELEQVNDFYRLEKDQNGKYYEGQTVQVMESAIGANEASPYARGLGSAWTYNLSECPSGWTCDPVKEAIGLGIRRLDQGHAGVTIDARTDKAVVVANLKALDESGIRAYWEMYVRSHAEEGNTISKELIIPQEVVSVVYPAWAQDEINRIYGGANGTPVALGANTCQQAVDLGAWDNPNPPSPATVTNNENGIVLIRPWWDPPTRFPLFQAGSDPSTAVRQAQMVLFPNQSATGDWNGMPAYLYVGCTVEQVIEDGRRSAPDWPFMYFDGSKWIEVSAGQPWPVTP